MWHGINVRLLNVLKTDSFKKKLSVVMTNFFGENIPIMATIKLETWCYWTWSYGNGFFWLHWISLKNNYKLKSKNSWVKLWSENWRTSIAAFKESYLWSHGGNFFSEKLTDFCVKVAELQHKMDSQFRQNF